VREVGEVREVGDVSEVSEVGEVSETLPNSKFAKFTHFAIGAQWPPAGGVGHREPQNAIRGIHIYNSNRPNSEIMNAPHFSITPQGPPAKGWGIGNPRTRLMESLYNQNRPNSEFTNFPHVAVRPQCPPARGGRHREPQNAKHGNSHVIKAGPIRNLRMFYTLRSGPSGLQLRGGGGAASGTPERDTWNFLCIQSRSNSKFASVPRFAIRPQWHPARGGGHNIYIYIYIDRERYRGMHVYVHIYIYISISIGASLLHLLPNQ